ncbi:MAG: DUF4190 domain-containing protein [Pedosphaera sp.]|nr:DUF4190 domain-containing protein [Pedosphaera sp.]
MNDTPRKSGLAVTNLVLGILSVLGCTLFTGIPAIICGIIGRTRARKTPESYAGDGLALGGIITGSIGSVLVYRIHDTVSCGNAVACAHPVERKSAADSMCEQHETDPSRLTHLGHR